MAAQPSRVPDACDVLLVGGGLANSMIALRLCEKRPDLRIVMIEQQAVPPPQTWSVFRTDLSDAQWGRLEPSFEARWDGYSVEFPGRRRRLTTTYACLSSRGLRERLQAVLGADHITGQRVAEVDGAMARCETGELFQAPLVIDGRGGRPAGDFTLAFQKFVGLELRLKRPHGLQQPIVMDAGVAQTDGYRFLYVLPFSETRLLVEDTRYSDRPDLDRPDIEAAALRYARGREWPVVEVLSRECGVLPIVLGGDPAGAWPDRLDGPALSGMRGLFFHPTTGYSLPDAMAVADLVAAAPELTSAAVRRRLRAHALELWRARGFYRALNRMLFRAAAPEQRYKVLDRFYGLPQGLIERFYAAKLTPLDKARVLIGRPPVPLGRAIMALPDRAEAHG
jgi:lycopene beta-cyclase